MEANDKVMAIAADRIAKARAELILARTFYGVLVSQVEPVASRQFPTMATDGRRHYYNPEFINGLPQSEVLGVQAHESEHDARRHHTRRNGRDPKEWNICTDLAINIDLIDAGFTLPKGALVDEKYRGMSAEDIYRTRELDRLKEQQKQQPQPQQPQQPQDGDESDEDDAGDAGDDDADGEQDNEQDGDDAGDEPGDDAGDDADGNGDGDDAEDDGDEGSGSGDEAGDDASDDGKGAGDGEPGEGEGDGKGEGKGSGSGDAGEPDADGSAGGSEPQSSGDPGGCGEVLDAADDAAENADQDARWERVLRQAAMLAAKRGDAPGHVTREIERSDHPPQDWREVLRAFFDGGAATMETWSRPNRRFIGSGLYLPGREREGVNRVAILVDTSGSMDDIALAAIEVETQAALDENIIDELVVIYGDTRVTRVDTYRGGDEIEFDPRGGGGTDMKPLFKYVADEIDASAIVCFTDGYIGDAGPEPAAPVLWAFTGYPQAVREHIANAPWGAAAIDVGSH